MVNRVRGRDVEMRLSEDFSLSIHIWFHSSKLKGHYDSTPLYHCNYYNYLKFFIVRINWIYMNYPVYIMWFGASPSVYWSWIIENRLLIPTNQSFPNES